MNASTTSFYPISTTVASTFSSSASCMFFLSPEEGAYTFYSGEGSMSTVTSSVYIEESPLLTILALLLTVTLATLLVGFDVSLTTTC